VIEASVIIRRDRATVYDTFRSLGAWQEILPDVSAVDVLYDDGRHQEFMMTVSKAAGPQTVRGIRFCTRDERIEIFQPQPPPGFSRMCGLWEFEALESGTTRVTATREFDLLPEVGPSYEQARSTLSQALSENLNQFKTALEAGFSPPA
jgi:ribosome-associated toxin RatA of RatAB toxin-antitoxin module